MVGDDARDLQAGQSAGTRTALANYGYVHPELRDRNLAGVHLVEKPADILELVDSEAILI